MTTAAPISIIERNRPVQPLLIEMLRYAGTHSQFWRDRFNDVGVTTRDINASFDHHALGFIEKQDLLDDQANHPPFGRLPAVVMDRVRRIHRTSGTTSRPFYTLLTDADIESTLDAGARAFRCAGVGPGDVVVHCLNYCMWSGGVTDHLCLERAGATVIPYGVGHSRGLLDLILALKPTAISCTPSYLGRLAGLLDAEFGVEPISLGLRMGLFGGEGGVQDDRFRDSIERVWGMAAIDANYGMSDVLSIFGAECPHRTGLHFHGDGIVQPELIDPNTGDDVEIATGAVGELVLTHLRREAQPLIRFRTHDVLRITGVDNCACGRSGMRFVVLGRSDDMLVVKGINVFPGAFRGVLSRFAGELTGAYRIVTDEPGPLSHIALNVEIKSDVPPLRRDALRTSIERAVRDALSVRALVTWVPVGALQRSDGKTRLVESFPRIAADRFKAAPTAN